MIFSIEYQVKVERELKDDIKTLARIAAALIIEKNPEVYQNMRDTDIRTHNDY